jgi:hypothetical protein
MIQLQVMTSWRCWLSNLVRAESRLRCMPTCHNVMQYAEHELAVQKNMDVAKVIQHIECTC